MAANTSPYRLAKGGLIDRSKPLAFYYNGKRMQGYAGDTVASALIANGVRVIARSFKYHRPRGFLGSGLEDPNAMVEIKDGYGLDAAVRAGQVRLAAGMQVRSVSGWPSLDFDIGALAGYAAKFIKAGFYYKTFMWPNWHLYEPFIRRTTGFGRINAKVPLRPRTQHHATCDVLVIGGGAAGIATANALSASGLKVFLVDDQPRLGGALQWMDCQLGGVAGAEWARDRQGVFEGADDIRVLNNTVVTGAYEGNMFTLLQSSHADGNSDDPGGVTSECLWKLRAKHVVLASGSVERPLVFAGNDRPGVMLASAVQKFLSVFAVAPANALAVFTNNDAGYAAAFAALSAGLQVPVVIDVRDAPPDEFLKRLAAAGVRCITGAEVINATGGKYLEGVVVAPLGGGPVQHIACDGLALSGGTTPLVHLAAHRGSKPFYQSDVAAFVSGTLPENWHAVGDARSPCSLTEAFTQAHDTARAICRSEGVAAPHVEPPTMAQLPGVPIKAHWRPGTGNPSEMFVDFQNDVTVADIELAVLEGYVSVEHLKRYTTLGMGTDQGRTSNINGLATLAALTGRDIADVGTTTFRPPYTAVRLGAIAGDRQGSLFRPKRLMPAHELHVSAGAVFEDFGWQRPDWYRSNGADREAAVKAEMAAVRNTLGIFDGSPLGKIEVSGPDAAAFLDRFYVSNMRTLKPGRIRYSVMLGEEGVIFDDGVVTCVDDTLYLAGPTSAHADDVASRFERWRQTEWPEMRVGIAPVTSNWASFAVAGPRARAALAALQPDFDISNAAFPHMSYRQGRIYGIPVRVSRISFTGELQYEINVPAGYGQALMRRLIDSAESAGGRLIGMEAWLRLRLEKGYLHVGSDTNGRTTPFDIGMGRVVDGKKADFIGKRSLSLSYGFSPEREQLVGLRVENGVLAVGGRILADGAMPPCRTQGYVTSACHSPSLGISIGLALIERGHARMGEQVRIFDSGTIVNAEICPPVFYDPENERLKA